MANIALYPGGYKPPHIGHYEAAKEALTQADKVIVFVGPKERDGITQDMSVALWKLYTEKDNIEIRPAGVSPVKDVYDFVELEAKDGDMLYFIKGKKDSEDPRFDRISTYAEKFGKKIPEPEFIDIEDKFSRLGNPVSGTSMRSYIKNNDKESFIDGLPLGVDEEAAWNIVTSLEEDFYDPRNKYYDFAKSSEWKAGKTKKDDIPPGYKYRRGGAYSGGGMGFGGMYEYGGATMNNQEKAKHAKNIKRLKKDLRKQGDQYIKVPDYLKDTLILKLYEQGTSNTASTVLINNTPIPLETMNTPEQQVKGMMGRDSLEGGMLFPYDKVQRRDFHMKGCKIPLDIVFINKDKINNIHHNCPPCKQDKCPNYSGMADNVLEFPGGFCKKNNVNINDKISLNINPNIQDLNKKDKTYPDIVVEIRQGRFNLIKNKTKEVQGEFWPDYVIKDFLYKGGLTAKGIKSENPDSIKAYIQDFTDQFPNRNWVNKTINLDWDSWTDKTKNNLEKREGGTKNPHKVPADAKRHSIQKDLIKKRGIAKEPIIVVEDDEGKYILVEGWHRTTQNLEAFPEGYEQNAWVYQKEIMENILTKEWWKKIINEILLIEGGAAGHMAHPFNLPNINDGKSLLDIFKKSADSLETNPGSVKIDGVNSSIRLVDIDGKKQFALDRGSKQALDIKGITKTDLEDRFKTKDGTPHGFIKTGGDVLDMFNEALPSLENDLKKLGAWDDPNILFNMEYVSGKTNVQKYDNNFIAIHGLNKIEMIDEPSAKTGKMLSKRKSKEISYDKSDLQSLLDNLKPIAEKNDFEVYGSVPTEMKKKPDFNAALSINYSIKSNEGDKTQSLEKWLSELDDIPEETFIFMNGKKLGAVSKAVYMALLNGENIDELFEKEEDKQAAIEGWTTYLATEKLGDEILKVLDSPMGTADNHEGVVIRDEKIANVPFKITGKFILGGLQTGFR